VEWARESATAAPAPAGSKVSSSAPTPSILAGTGNGRFSRRSDQFACPHLRLATGRPKLPGSALRFAGVACTFGAEGHANQRVPHPPSAGSSHADLHPALLIQTLHARFRLPFRRSFALLKHRRALSVFGCPSIEHQLHPTRHSSAAPPFTVHGPPTQPLARKEIATVYWHCRRFGYRYVYSQPRGRVEKCRLMAPPLCTGCQVSRWSLRHWMWRP